MRMMASTAWGMVVLLGAVPALEAQQWNGTRVRALVETATARRAAQLADSGLVDFRATAHGYLTFLAQLGEGFREPPQVVKADELALEVYWRAPNLSKQRIIGRRDTTLLPTDIQYHRDHLGIIQNNFPAIIRLGDGDEVRDVPHPLSPAGMGEYDFALADSLRITMPGRVIAVYEVKVRPRDDRQPRVIGALYLDRDNGQVVRMALSFTRAAFLDRQLEDLFVVLENGLVGTRFWLPRRQEIEIRRTATWLDYPVRGIIRGRWEIANYDINQNLPESMFRGAEIVQAPGRDLSTHAWPTRNILDSLPPDVRAVTAEEIRRVQAETRALVRADALRRARGASLAARGVSDVARFNRVEGLAIGAGVTHRWGAGFTFTARGRYGLADRAPKGAAELRWDRADGFGMRARASHDLRDVGLQPERSSLVNSIAAQEFASDFTNLFHARAVGLGVVARFAGIDWSLDVAREDHRGAATHARAATGRFAPPVPAASLRGWKGGARATQSTRLLPAGLEGRWTAAIQLWRMEALDQPACATVPYPCAHLTGARADAQLELERDIGPLRVLTRTIGGAVRAADLVPAQELVFLGGPVTVPGYAFHSLVGTAAMAQRLEVHVPVPFFGIPLGRFGNSGDRAVVAPHVTMAALRAVPATTPIARGAVAVAGAPDPLSGRASGVYPAVGVSLIAGFDLLRFDVSYGARDRDWRFAFDVSRLFWSVL